MGVMATIASGRPNTVPPDEQYLVEMGGSGNSDHFMTASATTGAANVGMNWSLQEGKEWITSGINIHAAH